MSEEEALHIPLIVENVFGYLDKYDLNCCRVAGPKYVWNKEACTILRSQIQVRFNTTADLIRFNDTFEVSIHGISLSLSSYFFDLDKLQQEQVQKFVKIAGNQVQQLRLRVHVAEAAAQVEPMIYTHFPNLNALSITFHNDSVASAAAAVSSSSPLLLPVGIKMGNLKKFQLCYEYSHENGNFPGHVFDHFILFASSLLQSAGKLQSFELKADNSWSQFTESLIQAVISNLSSSRLEQITLNAPLSGNNLRSLSTHPIHFPLESVRLEKIDLNSVSPSDLKLFLNRYRCSLRKVFLDLFGSQSTEISFPLGTRMEQLSCLTLGDFFGSLEWRNIPVLKTINLFDSSVQGIFPSIIYSSADCALESIDIQWSADPQDEFISMFSQVAPYLLPQLTSLAIGHDDCIAPLALIFSHCQHLKRLVLNKCAGVTDNLLCGMDTCALDVTWPEDYSDSEDDEYDKNGSVDAYKSIVAQAKKGDLFCVRQLPYIGDLKDLQYLTLTFDRYTYSDISVLYGIIHCGKLRELELLSPDISRQRSSRIIKQAGLDHLTKAKVCYEHILLCEEKY